MTLKLADWYFQVDAEATREQTTRYSFDHCTCGYCKNYYDTMESTYPEVCEFLDQFGVNIQGPSELMPFEPTLMLACYRIRGDIIQWGSAELWAGDIPVTVERGEDSTFLLWVGELQLPWVQQEAQEDVISPANLPEFLERMQDMWQLRHGTILYLS